MRDDTISFTNFLSHCKRHFLKLLLILAIINILSVVIVLNIDNIYRASVIIHVEDDSGSGGGMSSLNSVIVTSMGFKSNNSTDLTTAIMKRLLKSDDYHSQFIQNDKEKIASLISPLQPVDDLNKLVKATKKKLILSTSKEDKLIKISYDHKNQESAVSLLSLYLDDLRNTVSRLLKQQTSSKIENYSNTITSTNLLDFRQALSSQAAQLTMESSLNDPATVFFIVATNISMPL